MTHAEITLTVGRLSLTFDQMISTQSERMLLNLEHPTQLEYDVLEPLSQAHDCKVTVRYLGVQGNPVVTYSVLTVRRTWHDELAGLELVVKP